MTVQLYCGDCLDILPTIPAQSVDAVITDPPYPEISRDYGRMTEADWWDMMMGVCTEVRRILKPTGSAVFILQPNSRKVGSMRGWLWEFMAWVCRDWNMVQDAYWWNVNAMPVAGANTHGLMRASVKPTIWAGSADCYRNQDAVLWSESESNRTQRVAGRAGRSHYVSGWRGDGKAARFKNNDTLFYAAEKRGGVTPYNVQPFGPDKGNGASAHGHSAGTPYPLADWWTRYIVPPGGVVCDPFMGSGTMGLAAMAHGHSFIGIEQMPKYHEVAQRRIEQAQPALLTEAAQ